MSQHRHMKSAKLGQICGCVVNMGSERTAVSRMLVTLVLVSGINRDVTSESTFQREQAKPDPGQM